MTNRALGRLAVGVTFLASVIPAALGVETHPLLPASPADLDSARDQGRLAREFLRYATAAGEDGGEGSFLSWEFRLREGSFADVFVHEAIPRRFAVLRLRVRCRGAGMHLAAKLRDASGAEWTAPPVPLDAGADWRTVEFPIDAWTVAGWSADADGRFDFPTTYLAIIAYSVSPGEDYALDIARADAVLPDRPVLTATDITCPTVLRAGDEWAMAARCTLDGQALSDTAEARLVDDSGHVISAPLELPTAVADLPMGQEFAVSAAGTVPRFAFGGQYRLVLALGDAEPVTEGRHEEEGLATVTIVQRETGHTTARVTDHHGTPTLHLDGTPLSGMTYTAYSPGVEVFRDFCKAGVRLFSFSATPTESGYRLSRTAWLSPDEYDFSQLDERALMVLEACPDAYIFPRIYLHAPKWWSELHPDDLVLQQNTDGAIAPYIDVDGKPAPSWASEAWREDTVRGIERLVAHVESSPYADRVIGYHIASGTTEEWMMWGGNEGAWVDYSPVNEAEFRQWLGNRYADDASLRRAWADPDVTLDTASVPSRGDRETCLLGELRDPARERPVIDFYEYNSWLVADTIRYFARETKRIAGNDHIVGVFYGYLLQLIAEPRMQNSGHLALDAVLASPDVDFLTSPTSYLFRDPGTGTSHFMSLLDSVQFHGKLWFDENDIRTSLSPGEIGDGWGRQPTVDGDILQQNRELGNVIANGVAQWWFDVGGNRYDDARLMAHNAALRQAADRALEYDRAPVDEIAFVVDGESNAYLRVAAPLSWHLLALQIPQAARIGAPIGWYSLGDIADLPPRRMYVFLNCFAPTAEERAAVDRLKADGRVLVFVGPAGVYRDGALDPEAMKALTGLRIGFSTDPARLLCQWAGPTEAVTYGADAEFAPVAFCDDTAADALGTLADGRTGLALRDLGEWTAVHSAAPALPAALLRELALRAGVHLYTDDAVVWASRGLLSVSVNEGGPRTIVLPEPATVIDLVTHDTLARDTRSFTIDIAPRDTAILGLRR